MSLRTRLTLAFVVVVLAPLLIGAVIIVRAVPGIKSQVVQPQLTTAARGVAAALVRQCGLAEAVSGELAWESVATSPTQAVKDVAAQRAAYVAILAPDGSVRASAGTLPKAVSVPPSRLGSCREGAGSSPYVTAAHVPITASNGSARGTAVVALPLEQRLLQSTATSKADVTLLAGTTVVASSLPAAQAGALAQQASRLASGKITQIDQHLFYLLRPGPGQPVSVLVRGPAGYNPTSLEQTLAAVVVAALVVAIAVGWALSRMTTRPLIDLAQAADRVARGDLSTQIPVETHDEVGQLAVAFNDMTGDLRTYLDELMRSRDQLRGQLSRLGETLSSTHDLNRILTVILDTAATSVGAEGGALLMGSGGRGELYVKVSRGLPTLPQGAHLRVGEGALGRVASVGEAVHGRVDDTGVLVDDGYPGRARPFLGVPLTRSGRVLGVLGLYRTAGDVSFEAGDVETIRTFAAQATVAIDNVLLHQEAQRLSITDGLTGLWNYRYFTMNFSKEIERAARFGRPLALLLLDLDKFKNVNDLHGHQRGDSVLIELATRVSGEIREVDMLARYGGEEFVLVLPETDAAGARQAAERMCEVVRHRPFGHQGEQPLRITVSVGVAVFPEHGSTAAALVKAADTALYAAKDGGRDGWRMADRAAVAASGGETRPGR